MVGSAYAFFLSLPAGDPLFRTPLGFVAAALVTVALGSGIRDEARLTGLLWRGLAVGLALLPLLRLAAGGTRWAGAVAARPRGGLSVGLFLLLGGGGVGWVHYPGGPSRAVQPAPEPAARAAPPPPAPSTA